MAKRFFWTALDTATVGPGPVSIGIDPMMTLRREL
jgi:hypothetical protein